MKLILLMTACFSAGFFLPGVIYNHPGIAIMAGLLMLLAAFIIIIKSLKELKKMSDEVTKLQEGDF